MAIRFAICIAFLAVTTLAASTIGASVTKEDMYNYLAKDNDGNLDFAQSDKYTEFLEWETRNPGADIRNYFAKNNDGKFTRKEHKQYIAFDTWKKNNTIVDDEPQPPVGPEVSVQPCNGIAVLDDTTEAVKRLTISTLKIQRQLLENSLYKNISSEINGLRDFINGLEQGIKKPVKEALVELALSEYFNTKNRQVLQASATDVSDRVNSINGYVDMLDNNGPTSNARVMKQVVKSVVAGFTNLQTRVHAQLDDAKNAYAKAAQSVGKGNTKLKTFVIKLEKLTTQGQHTLRSALLDMVESGCNDGLVGNDVGLAICHGIESKNMEYKIRKFEKQVKDLVEKCDKVSKNTGQALVIWRHTVNEIETELNFIKDSTATVKEAMSQEETTGSISSCILKNMTEFKGVAKVSKKNMADALDKLQKRMDSFSTISSP